MLKTMFIKTYGMKGNTRVYTPAHFRLYRILCRVFIACYINNHLEIHFQSITLKTVLKSILITFENVVKNFILSLCLDFWKLCFNIDETKEKLCY
jgi:hypothetical protein